MFWNDPILYGATLPYRDINVQTPFLGTLPWQQNIPRFVPQFYGFQPPFQTPFQHIPQMGVNPFLQTQIPQMGVNPFLQTQIPQMGVNPYLYNQAFTPFVPYNFNLPQYNWYRPFTC